MSWQTPARTAETSSIVVSGNCGPDGLVIRPSVPTRPGCQHAEVLEQRNRVRIADKSVHEAAKRRSKAPEAEGWPGYGVIVDEPYGERVKRILRPSRCIFTRTSIRVKAPPLTAGRVQ